jgi:hypothetical protein
VDVVVGAAGRVDRPDPEVGPGLCATEANVVVVPQQRGPAKRLEDGFIERRAGGRVGTLNRKVSEQDAQK